MSNNVNLPPNVVLAGPQGPPGPIGGTVPSLAQFASLPLVTAPAGAIFAYTPVAGGPSVYYQWAPGSTATADGVTVLTGNGGRWLIAPTAGATRSTPLTLMCLADSWGHYWWLDGYRTALDHRLRQLGRPVRMIGTQFEQRNVSDGHSGIPTPPTANDNLLWMSYAWHEGHGGFTLGNIASNLATYIATPVVAGTSAGVPDLATVLLGTNDIFQQGTNIFGGTQTQAAALAAMQASLSTIITTLLAAGTKVVFVCDVAHLVPPTATGGVLTAANALCDAYNAALPAFLATFGPQVVAVTGLANFTAADRQPNTGHPNRRGNNRIGTLLADAIAPYVPSTTPAVRAGPGAQFPRRVIKGDAPAPVLQTIATTDGVTQTLAGWQPPTNGNLCVVGDFMPTSLPAGVHNVFSYGTGTNSFAIQTNGSTLQLSYAGGAAFIINIPLTVGAWHRIAAWWDYTTGWVMLAVNGVVVGGYAVGPTWTFNAGQAAYFGYITPTTQAGCPGVFSRWEMHYGSALPAFADVVGYVESDYWESNRIPGLQAELIFNDGTGSPAETLSGSTATLVGSPAWVAAGTYPKWCDEGGATLLNEQPLGGVGSLAVGQGAPAAGLSVDLSMAQYGFRAPASTFAAIQALANPPTGVVYYATDLSAGRHVRNVGSPASPIWLPEGGVVCYEMSGFSGGTSFYQGPASTGLGLTAAAGTIHCLIRRNANFTVALDAIFGCNANPWNSGKGIVLELTNATTPADTYTAASPGVTSAPSQTTRYWPEVLSDAGSSKGNLVLLSLVMGTSALVYVNGVPGAAGNTTNYNESGVRVGLGDFGNSSGFPFVDGTIIGVAVDTVSHTQAMVNAVLSDIARLGPEKALLNCAGSGTAYIYLAKNAGATLASAVASGGAGGGGPTLTRLGTVNVTPFVAPAWGQVL